MAAAAVLDSFKSLKHSPEVWYKDDILFADIETRMLQEAYDACDENWDSRVRAFFLIIQVHIVSSLRFHAITYNTSEFRRRSTEGRENVDLS
jgi:hypothetical protein